MSEQLENTNLVEQPKPFDLQAVVSPKITLEELLRLQIDDISPVTKKPIKYSPDFRLSVQEITNKGVRIIIHASSFPSETLDFWVNKNQLEQIWG
jgi:hypothetical protein